MFLLRLLRLINRFLPPVLRPKYGFQEFRFVHLSFELLFLMIYLQQPLFVLLVLLLFVFVLLVLLLFLFLMLWMIVFLSEISAKPVFFFSLYYCQNVVFNSPDYEDEFYDRK